MTINKVATGAHSNNLRVLYVGAGGGGGGGGRAHQYESNGSVAGGGGGAGGLFTKSQSVSAGQKYCGRPGVAAGGASKTQGQNGNATSINAAGIGQTSVAVAEAADLTPMALTTSVRLAPVAAVAVADIAQAPQPQAGAALMARRAATVIPEAAVAAVSQVLARQQLVAVTHREKAARAVTAMTFLILASTAAAVAGPLVALMQAALAVTVAAALAADQ